MQRIPISSSTVKSAGYVDGILEIEFRKGPVYRYFDVPTEVAEAFMASDSKGRYFLTHIRDRYEYNEVDPDTARLDDR